MPILSYKYMNIAGPETESVLVSQWLWLSRLVVSVRLWGQISYDIWKRPCPLEITGPLLGMRKVGMVKDKIRSSRYPSSVKSKVSKSPNEPLGPRAAWRAAENRDNHRPGGCAAWQAAGSSFTL